MGVWHGEGCWGTEFRLSKQGREKRRTWLIWKQGLKTWRRRIRSWKKGSPLCKTRIRCSDMYAYISQLCLLYFIFHLLSSSSSYVLDVLEMNNASKFTFDRESCMAVSLRKMYQPDRLRQSQMMCVWESSFFLKQHLTIVYHLPCRYWRTQQQAGEGALVVSLKELNKMRTEKQIRVRER